MTTLHYPNSNRARVTALCAALSCSIWMHAAVACPGAECEGGEVFPRGGVMPANHVSFVWQRTEGLVDQADLLKVTKRSDADAATSELTFEQTELSPGKFLLTSDGDFAPGDVLELEYRAGTCGLGLALQDTLTTLTLGPEAPLPTKLGAMTVSAGEGKLDHKGLCADQSYRAYAELDVDFDDEALPFKDLFMLSAEVNSVERRERFYLRFDNARDDWSQTWPSALSGRRAFGARVLLSADCNDTDDEDGQLLAGTYEVNLVGTLPDGTTLRTPRVPVTLECEQSVCSTNTAELDVLCSEVYVSADAGQPIPSDAGVERPACDVAYPEYDAETLDDVTTKPGSPTSDDEASAPQRTNPNVGDAATSSIPVEDAQAKADAGDTPDDVNGGAKTPTRRRSSGCSVGNGRMVGENGVGATAALMGLAACTGLTRRRKHTRA